MASNQDILITCRSCSVKAPVSQMRLAQNGKDMLCRSCVEKQQMRAGAMGSKAAISMGKSLGKAAASAAKSAPLKPVVSVKAAPKPATKPVKSSLSDNVTYFCGKCRYKFTRKADFHVNKCPYCGSPKLETTDKFSAETLIKQAKPGEDY